MDVNVGYLSDPEELPGLAHFCEHMLFLGTKKYPEYISMLRKEGPKKWVWEEQRDLMALKFRFKDTQEPRSLVMGQVHLSQEFPMEDVLSAYYIMTEWRPELIEELLALLTPENVRVGIVPRCFADKCTQSEPWYRTKYMQEDIEEPTIKQWKSAKSVASLHLPPPNEFIPTKLDLERAETKRIRFGVAPTIIKDTPLIRLWFKKDDEFHLPKAVLTFSLVSPLAYFDPTNYNLTSIWVLLLKGALEQYTSSTEDAGLAWTIRNVKQGLSVMIEGYDDKLHVLLEEIIDEIFNFKTDDQRFKIWKEKYISIKTKNVEAEHPHKHAMNQVDLCLSDVLWTPSQLLKAAKDITPEQLDDFTSRFLRKVHIEALMFGNLSPERALDMADYMENKVPEDAIPLLAQQLLLYREVEMEKGTSYLREIQNSGCKSSCACLYYACGVRATRQNVTLELLRQTLYKPCSHVFGSEQLVYKVSYGVRRSNGVQGFRIIGQSDRHPAYIEEQIESFLRRLQEYLEMMTEEEFLKHRSSLAASKLERPKTMPARASQLWSEIVTQEYNFDRSRVEAEELNTITQNDLLEFYKKYISEDSSERRKLSVYVVSIAEGGAGENPESDENTDIKNPVVITDPVEFKSRRRLYPHPDPFVEIPKKGGEFETEDIEYIIIDMSLEINWSIKVFRMWYLLICLVILSYGREGRSEMYEGDTCSKNGVLGTCRYLANCDSAKMDIQNRRKVVHCGFDNDIPIVCCVDSPVRGQTSNLPVATTIAPRPSTTQYVPMTYDYEVVNREGFGSSDCPPVDKKLTSPKTGRKAFDKCLEYQELVYPCEDGPSLAAGASKTRGQHCHHSADHLIIGGQNAEEHEFLHMALLGYGDDKKNLQWLCGGSLISDRYILTAGHCISNRDVVPLNQYMVPACLEGGDGVDESKVSAAGWGHTQYKGDVSQTLQKVLLNKFSTEECYSKFEINKYMDIGFDDQTQICYGDKGESKDTCQGDSGGPIMIKSKKINCMYVIVGVTSFGRACGFVGEPGIYTKVAAYIPWIESVVWP
ncbi:hypothetical protein K1T71_014670 [Dendrolimus kikuchii]|uniref:Uncharacterized protein n=1 Tax=Dendrolimus kikuchii TaxID=765133 RepID=A0ACC1CF17_9NEOP|nr:hypothetical protein K1T71_014670 [Dendrolimus kikuchii]